MRALRFVRSIPILRAQWQWIALFSVLGMIAYLSSSAEFGPSDSHLDRKGPRLAETVLDRPLSEADARRYREIFALQSDGDWTAAEKLVDQLDEKLLLGHVLANRYLHPKGYRSGYGELAAWLTHYGDHPDAEQIYKLALNRKPKNQAAPQRPTVQKNSILETRLVNNASRHQSKKKLTKSERRQVARLKAQIRRNLRRVYLTKTEQLLENPKVRRLFDQFELDEAYSELAAGWHYWGNIEKAFRMAGEVAKRSGEKIPISHWTAGLTAWRLGKIHTAAKHFELLALSNRASRWNRAAGAYWAARAHLALRQSTQGQRWLTVAAIHSRTFYGLLARYQLGLESDLNFEAAYPDRPDIDKLTAIPGGARARALAQIGQIERAEQELLRLNEWNEPGITQAMLALTHSTKLPGLGLEIAKRALNDRAAGWSETEFDAALYPVPPWRPQKGFHIDRALIFAFMRQESSFDPLAKSPDGARGLMQLMPRTAASLDKNRGFKGRQRDELYDPSLNMSLGQRYLSQLLRSRRVGNDVLRLAAAYNAGPGNLRRWERRMDYSDDPLLFIETLPVLETRLFVERVLTNLWIYRQRFGQAAPTLVALASGRWPTYRALDQRALQVASRHELALD